MMRIRSEKLKCVVLMAGAVAVARFAGCGVAGPPAGGGGPETFIFSPSSEPIEGFTFVHTDVEAESHRGRNPLNIGRSFAAGAVLNDRIYAIGGDIQAVEIDSVEVLDMQGGQVWTPVASLPSARSGVCAAAANGRVYAFGGFRYNPPTMLGETLEYNPDTDQWTPRAAMLAPRAFCAAAAVNNRIYVMGGARIENGFILETNAVDEYDPVTDTWTPMAPMSSARSELAAAEVDGRIYALGGRGGLTVNEEFDPVANAWTTKTGMNVGRLALGAFGWNGRIYAVGGRQQSGTNFTFLKVIEVYSPASNNWGSVADLQVPRSAFGGAAIGPSFFMAGGDLGPTSFAHVSSAEYFARTRFFTFRKN